MFMATDDAFVPLICGRESSFRRKSCEAFEFNLCIAMDAQLLDKACIRGWKFRSEYMYTLAMQVLFNKVSVDSKVYCKLNQRCY